MALIYSSVVEHCTGNTKVLGSNPAHSLNCLSGLFNNPTQHLEALYYFYTEKLKSEVIITALSGLTHKESNCMLIHLLTLLSHSYASLRIIYPRLTVMRAIFLNKA